MSKIKAKLKEKKFFTYTDSSTENARVEYPYTASARVPRTKGGTVIVIDPLKPGTGTPNEQGWTYLDSYGEEEVLITYSEGEKRICVSDLDEASRHCFHLETILLYPEEGRCNVYTKVETVPQRE